MVLRFGRGLVVWMRFYFAFGFPALLFAICSCLLVLSSFLVSFRLGPCFLCCLWPLFGCAFAFMGFIKSDVKKRKKLCFQHR